MNGLKDVIYTSNKIIQTTTKTTSINRCFFYLFIKCYYTMARRTFSVTNVCVVCRINFLSEPPHCLIHFVSYSFVYRLWPSYASAHNNLGTLVENESEAENHFLLALRYSTDHVNAHYNLGQLYR